MDENGDGQLDLSELRNMLLHLNVAISDTELRKRLAKFDTSGDGKMNFDEFRALFESVNDKPGKEIDEVRLPAGQGVHCSLPRSFWRGVIWAGLPQVRARA